MIAIGSACLAQSHARASLFSTQVLEKWNIPHLTVAAKDLPSHQGVALVRSFEGTEFQKATSTMARVLGPMLVSCNEAAGHHPLQSLYEVQFSNTLKDISVCFVGLDPQVAARQAELLRWMGGWVSTDVATCDIIVAESARSQVVRTHLCKTVTTTWLADTWPKVHRNLVDAARPAKDYPRHKIKVLTGCTIFLDQEIWTADTQTRSLMSIVAKNQGAVLASRLEDATHYVTNKMDHKFYRAIELGVLAVRSRWLTNCCVGSAPGWKDEADYSLIVTADPLKLPKLPSDPDDAVSSGGSGEGNGGGGGGSVGHAPTALSGSTRGKGVGKGKSVSKGKGKGVGRGKSVSRGKDKGKSNRCDGDTNGDNDGGGSKKARRTKSRMGLMGSVTALAPAAAAGAAAMQPAAGPLASPATTPPVKVPATARAAAVTGAGTPVITSESPDGKISFLTPTQKGTRECTTTGTRTGTRIAVADGVTNSEWGVCGDVSADADDSDSPPPLFLLTVDQAEAAAEGSSGRLASGGDGLESERERKRKRSIRATPEVRAGVDTSPTGKARKFSLTDTPQVGRPPACWLRCLASGVGEWGDGQLNLRRLNGSIAALGGRLLLVSG
jgi:hypothetical protein